MPPPLGLVPVSSLPISDVRVLPPPTGWLETTTARPPAFVHRPFMPVAVMAAFAFAMPVKPEPHNSALVDWQSHWPDAVTRPTMPASQQRAAWFDPFPLPAAIIFDFAHFPDIIWGRTLPAADQQFFTTNIRPERTSPLAITWWPDRVDRPFLAAANQLAVTNISPRPEGTIVLDWQGWYPERALRSWMLTAEHPYTTLDPFPRPATPIFDLARWPDIIWGKTLPVSSHPAFSAANVQPERTQDLAWTWWPDSVVRPVVRAADHPFVTGISPKPEETLQLDWQGRFPERALRSWLPTSEHPFFVINIQPERTSPLAAVIFADFALRAFLPTADQPFVTSVYPKPEEKQDHDWEAQYPDIVWGRTFLTADQQAFAINIRPERTSLLATTWWPDSVTRPFLSAADQPFIDARNLAPERTSVLASTWWPDSVLRPTVRAADQPFVTEISPQPERTQALASTSWPDYVLRPFLITADQPFVTGISPRPEEKQDHDWEAQYPDFAIRSWGLTTASQLFTTNIPPRPEPHNSSFVDWNPNYPDRAVRAWMLTADHPYTTLDPFPRPDVPIAPWLNTTTDGYPDRVTRAWMPTADHLFVTEISPQPERKSPLAWTQWPDIILRPYLLTGDQLFTTNISPRPERKSPLAWTGWPDFIWGKVLPVSSHQAFSAANIQPERKSPLAVEIFPDFIWRATLPVSSYPFVTSIYPKPEERQDHDWEAVYPDFATRSWMLTADHLFVTSIHPKPEERQDHDWESVYPDYVLRAQMLPTEQLVLSPEPVSPVQVLGISVFYPDAIARAATTASNQFAVTELSPSPVAPLLISTIYPNRIEGQVFFTSQQLASSAFGLVDVEVSELDWLSHYPDRIERPFLPVSEFWAVTSLVRQPTLTISIIGIPSTEEFGRPSVAPVIGLLSILSEETFGGPIVINKGHIPIPGQSVGLRLRPRVTYEKTTKPTDTTPKPPSIRGKRTKPK